MSRVGKKPIVLPAGVTVTNNNNVVTVTGPKGTLTKTFDKVITINVEGNEVTCTRPNDEIKSHALHGTTRALLNSMVVGVSEGFKKELEIVGIGYRGQMQGNKLVLNVGYSHPVEIEGEEGVKIETPTQTTIKVSGISKERVGEIAARIRAVKKPEPYKGKGIKYVGERIIRKEGKTAGKK